MTVTCDINNTGSTKSDYCNKIASNIWNFCITEKLWISAAYIANASYKEANQQSRILEGANDWQMGQGIQ